MSETNDLRLPIEKARWSLAILWFFGAGVMFIALIVMSAGSKFAVGSVDKSSDVWGWLLPHLVPTLSLIVSVLASTAVDRGGPAMEEPTVRKTFHRLTMGMSAFYLFLILVAILSSEYIQERHSDDKFTVVDAMKSSNLWLLPLQGVVVLCIGTLFFKQESGKVKATGKKKPPASKATPAE
jgi:hypothetical protein